jgi:hypothetical protein
MLQWSLVRHVDLVVGITLRLTGAKRFRHVPARLAEIVTIPTISVTTALDR